MQSFLRMKEITERIGLSRWTIWRLIAQGDFPKGVKIGKRAVGWLDSDIQAWVQQRHQEAQL